jgi:hypothetical protein
MRETALLAIAVVAALLGMGLGRLLFPKRVMTAVTLVAPAQAIPSAPLAPVTRVTSIPAPPEPVDANSTPEAIHAWRRQDKDELVQRVEKLTATEAEHLCFLLRLIPRDEVFDQINVKGRLKRHIDDMRMAEEFTDLETAFHELDRDR